MKQGLEERLDQLVDDVTTLNPVHRDDWDEVVQAIGRLHRQDPDIALFAVLERLQRRGMSRNTATRIQRRLLPVFEGRPVCECQECARTYYYDSRKGHTRRLCNSCNSNKKRLERRRKMVAHLGGRCSVCGYDRSEAALQFHHPDPATKGEFALSSSHTRSWEVVRAELDKCVLLCANCHAELHDGNSELWTRAGTGRPRNVAGVPPRSPRLDVPNS